MVLGEKKVSDQTLEVSSAIHQFNAAFKNNEFDKAIEIFSQHQALGIRNDIINNLYNAIYNKINKNFSFENVQNDLLLLSSIDAIELINHAIKTKLSYEYENNLTVTSANKIINFAQNSIRYNNLQNLERCYDKLLSDALKVDMKEETLLSLIKMNIADNLIKNLIGVKRSHTQDSLELAQLEHEEMTLRYQIFDDSQNYSSLHSIFIKPHIMDQINGVINNRSDINMNLLI